MLEAAAEALFFEDDAEPDGLSRREAGRRQADRAAAEYLASFQSERQRLAAQLSSLFPSVALLDDAATLAYLHSTVSTKLHPVAVPAVPDCLDALLTDEPLTGGGKPKLGRHYLGVLSIKSFPNESCPGLLDALNRLPHYDLWRGRHVLRPRRRFRFGVPAPRRHPPCRRARLGQRMAARSRPPAASHCCVLVLAWAMSETAAE